jgi:hypothetical protein
MLKRLAVFALAALFSAAFVAPNVLAKDDAEKLKEQREKVRAKYAEDKEGFPFYDLVYWVDAKKLEDSRWSMDSVREPKHDRGLQLIANWVNEASAAEGMNIRVLVFKFLHEERRGSSTTPFSYPFNNLGESVRCSDLDGMLEGFYEDWKRGAKDVLEDQCEKPKKSKFKVPKLQAAAVGTDPNSEQRIRMEWYAWINGKEKSTYMVQIQYGPALYNKERLVEKGGELVKNIKEIKDKVKWK